MGQRDDEWYHALGYTICDVQHQRKALVIHKTGISISYAEKLSKIA